MGQDQFYIVGFYIPPLDLTTLAEVEKAREQYLKGCMPILIRDLNVDVEPPRGERCETITVQVADMDITCITR